MTDITRARFAHIDAPEAFIMRGAVLMVHDSMGPQTLHAHRPIELIVALDGSFLYKSSDGPATCHSALMVRPTERHAILRSDGPLARLYVDPEIRRLDGGAPWSVPDVSGERDDLLHRLKDFHRGHRSVGTARDLICRWKTAWLGWLEQAPPCDARVIAALRHLDDQVIPTANRASVAAIVNLSPSRVAAIFAQETGMTLRDYIAWRRVLLAARLIRRGQTLTSAALTAGFADSAHFSRAYRKTFGVAPSWLQTIEILPPPSSGRTSRLPDPDRE